MRPVGLRTSCTAGLLRENPVLVTMVGLGPALAVSTRVIDGLVIGLAVLIVVVGTGVAIRLLRDYVPQRMSDATSLVIGAGLVTVFETVLRATAPGLSAELGVFVPLVVVHAVLVDRAAAAPDAGSPGSIALRSLGVGAGFLISLTLVSLVRELLSLGTVTLPAPGSLDGVVRVRLFAEAPARFFGLAPGMFIVPGYLAALAVAVRSAIAARGRGATAGREARTASGETGEGGGS